MLRNETFDHVGTDIETYENGFSWRPSYVESSGEYLQKVGGPLLQSKAAHLGERLWT